MVPRLARRRAKAWPRVSTCKCVCTRRRVRQPVVSLVTVRVLPQWLAGARRDQVWVLGRWSGSRVRQRNQKPRGCRGPAIWRPCTGAIGRACATAARRPHSSARTPTCAVCVVSVRVPTLGLGRELTKRRRLWVYAGQGHGHGYGHGLLAAESVLLRVDCKTVVKLLLCGAGSRTSRLEDWDRQRH